MAQITLTINESGKTQKAKVGDTIIVQLPENPTTGYRWELKEIDKAIEPPEIQYKPDEGAQMGGGGTKTFEFKLKSKGTTTIKIINKRSWEPENSAIQHFEAIIIIN